MHEYDVTLKLLLQSLVAGATRVLTGVTIVRWYNVELPEVRNTRVDRLGETADGGLIHIELQSGNDSSMVLRMLEYAVGVYRIYKKFPRQILLYVGEAPMRMDALLVADRLSFSYEQVDIRALDGERLLASSYVGDNVIAILTRLRDQKEAVRWIVRQIGKLASAERELAFKQLLILAGLRDLEQFVEEETSKVPILIDINDHKVIGPALRQGRLEGREEARQESPTALRLLLDKRFGPLPSWVEENVANRSIAEIREILVALFDASSLEQLIH